MAIERLELADGQWFEYVARPAHGVIRKIARDTDRASRSRDPLEAEDQLVLNLGLAWQVHDIDGADLPFQRQSFDRVPQDVWAEIVAVCTDVLESTVPNPRTR